MILLSIYLTVSIATLLMFWLIGISAAHRFKKLYPDVKIPKSHWSDKIFTVFRSILVSVIPIINLIILFGITFKAEETIEDSILKLHKKYFDEGEQNEK